MEFDSTDCEIFREKRMRTSTIHITLLQLVRRHSKCACDSSSAPILHVEQTARMAAKSVKRLTVLLVLFFAHLATVHSIRCYQCNSTDSTHPFQCNEFLTNDVDLEPESCEGVFNAQYCVKHTGRFEVNLVIALDCYQCTSADEWQCMDGELVKYSLLPKNCSHMYEARYCIQTVGRYGGGIGTKRFCSASNLGNYCNYVKQPGDKLSYRTCVFTCSSDGCNSASTLAFTILWIFTPFLLTIRQFFFYR